MAAILKRHYIDYLPRITAKEVKTALEQTQRTRKTTYTDKHHNAKVIGYRDDISDTGAVKLNIDNYIHKIDYQVEHKSASNKFYLLCDCCNKKRQYLIVIKNLICCRELLGSHYHSQSESPIERLMRKIRKKRAAIWGGDMPNINALLSPDVYCYPKREGRQLRKYLDERRQLLELENKFIGLAGQGMSIAK